MTPFNKSHPLRIVTLCSGYDSQCLALKYLQDQHPNFAFDLIAWSEIEPSAIQAHNLLFQRSVTHVSFLPKPQGL